jgi:hypothetical protein
MAVDPTRAAVSNLAEPVAASARLSWPSARGYLVVSVHVLVAAES